MKTHVLPNTIAFEGVLDENVSIDEIEAPLNKLKKDKKSPSIAVDFSKVPYANSAGVVIWLKVVYAAGIALRYVNTPVWLVNQFNMIRGYFEGGSYVESVHAPYYSLKTKDSRVFTLTLGKDIPIQENYAGISFPARIVDGKNYEPDFDPEQYFSFISENFTKFKEKLK